MPITQQSFFGATIQNFNCSIGWGSQSSTCSINLVEDPVLEQEFSPSAPNLPAYFIYDNFAFGGLVQAYKRKNSPQGYPVFEVTLTDPRDILDGVQIIIDGYTGAIGAMPNLFNVYGYLETISFGNAEVNDGGILTSKLIIGINALLGITALASPINYMGVSYYLDLTSLPSLPAFHRMGGGVSLSMMDIISRICEDGACDYFIRLVNAGGLNVIKVHTVSRAAQPTFGMISEFINANTTGEAVSNEIGLEGRNEIVGKFLVGGNQTAMYYQFPDDGPLAGFEDDTILQWWGVDANGSPIIQEAYEADNPKFTLDSRGVQVNGVGAEYTTDVEEMRNAIGGQTSWETFLGIKDTVAGPHFGKATAVAIARLLGLNDILGAIAAAGNAANVLALVMNGQDARIARLDNFFGRHVNRLDRNARHQENINDLFRYVSDFANEYYGKKFMVRIADVQAHRESETDRIIVSMEPTEGGYLDEAEVPAAIGNKRIPNDTTKILTEDGRLQAYVRFDNADTLDLKEIQQADYILEANSVWIRCKVDPIIYVLDLVTLESPRVIITLPGRVCLQVNKADFAGCLKDILGPGLDAAGVNALGVAGGEREAIFNALLTRWGGDKLNIGKGGLAELPDMAAIPLKSNILTYGPWQAHGANGKVEFEQNNELVPWLYGGFTQLNIVGNALVSDALAGQTMSETGSITVPDGPNYNIGDELIAGGPFVTNVTVEVGTNGVTSTYRMETWTPRFGKLAKLNAERMSKLAKENVVRKREMRKFNKILKPNHPIFEARANALKVPPPPQANPHSSHTYIGGQLHKIPDEDGRFSDVAILPAYNAFSPLSTNYGDKAFMSMDGLLRPFSTKFTDTNVTHYEEPDASAEKTVEDLDPFQTGNDIDVVACDTALADDIHMSDMTSNDRRPIALRGPLVVAGWGYDTNGKPVPNLTPDSPGDDFVAEHLVRSDKWKVGPVDLRWDTDRKVWVGGGFAEIRIATSYGTILPESSGLVDILDLTDMSTTRDYAIDHLMHTGQLIPGNTRIIIAKELTSQNWYILSAACGPG